MITALWVAALLAPAAFLIGVSVGSKSSRAKAKTTPAEDAAPATTWCEGCNEIRPLASMEWTGDERYRCAICRGVPPHPKAAPEAPESFEPQPIGGRNITLDSVAPGQRVIAIGGSASIDVAGDVGEGAVLMASGGSATINVRGRVGAHASLTARGGGATVTVHSADPTAILRAQGGGSKVTVKSASSRVLW
jgi:hypothetical protein